MSVLTGKYRGFKIHVYGINPHGRRRSVVEVTTSNGYGTGVHSWYRAEADNAHEALAYAQNAIAYHLDGDGNWPGGLPLIIPKGLHWMTKERRRRRFQAHTARRRPLGFVDGRVEQYLTDKQEDL